MRERSERKFSGYSLNIPEGLHLFVVDVRTGRRKELGTGPEEDGDTLEFWMRQPFSYLSSLVV